MGKMPPKSLRPWHDLPSHATKERLRKKVASLAKKLKEASERAQKRFAAAKKRVEQGLQLQPQKELPPSPFLEEGEFSCNKGGNNYVDKVLEEMRDLQRLQDHDFRLGENFVDHEEGYFYLNCDGHKAIMSEPGLNKNKQQEFVKENPKVLLGQKKNKCDVERAKAVEAKGYRRLLRWHWGRAAMGSEFRITRETQVNRAAASRFHCYLQCEITQMLLTQYWNAEELQCRRLIECWVIMRKVHRDRANREFDLGPIHTTVATKLGGSHVPHRDCSDHRQSLGAALACGKYKGAHLCCSKHGIACASRPGHVLWCRFCDLLHVSSPLIGIRDDRPTCVFFLDNAALPKYNGKTVDLDLRAGTPLWLDHELEKAKLVYETKRMTPHEIMARLDKIWEQENPDDDRQLGHWYKSFICKHAIM